MSEGRVNVAGVEVSTDHYIDGRRVASKDRFLDRSPVDGSALAEISAGGKSEADAAVAAARKAFPAWAALGPEGRAPILQRFAEGIKARTADLAAVETIDNGSLLTGNQHRVVPRAALNISYFAEHALTLRGHTIDSPEVVNHVHYDPAGVAVLVTPWNAPLMLTTWKVGPALAAGNTIVIKPPEWAPLTCSLLADIAQAAGVPAGVLNVVQGIGEDAGAALVEHKDIDRISFTGSTDTAKIIGTAAARSITPMSSELGGKSPFIVCADADLKAAAQTVAGQYINAGQVCLAGTRILVEEKIAGEFLELVREAVGHMTVGDPREATTRVGPLIHPEHFERVQGFVDRARKDGAGIPLGWRASQQGRSLLPANADLWRQTRFGDLPVGSLRAGSDLEHLPLRRRSDRGRERDQVRPRWHAVHKRRGARHAHRVSSRRGHDLGELLLRSRTRSALRRLARVRHRP